MHTHFRYSTLLDSSLKIAKKNAENGREFAENVGKFGENCITLGFYRRVRCRQNRGVQKGAPVCGRSHRPLAQSRDGQEQTSAVQPCPRGLRKRKNKQERQLQPIRKIYGCPVQLYGK